MGVGPAAVRPRPDLAEAIVSPLQFEQDLPPLLEPGEVGDAAGRDAHRARGQQNFAER
jgi:hypothetical protein